jgi:uncharacterized protein
MNGPGTNADTMIADRIKVICADSHVMEPPDLWTSRLDTERWGGAVPHVRHDDRRGEDRWHIGGHWSSGVAKFSFAGWNEFPPSHPNVIEEADPGAWDPHKRLERMDEYGIYAQVLYPNLIGFSSIFFMDIEDHDLRKACVQAYNDFVLDFASADLNRLVPLMWLPFWDVDLAVEEMRRCAGRGHKGVIFPSNFAPVGLPLLPDPHWNPVWEAAQSLELSINFHVGFQASRDESRAALGANATAADHTKESALFMLGNARTIADVVVYGICHRYPRLNFVSVESGFGWMPYFGELLDWQWLNSGCRNVYPELNLLPSEYIKRQVYGTFWFEREVISSMVDEYADTAMFSTDYPHPTSLTPGPASFALNPRDAIQANLGTLKTETLTKLLHTNAARVYHIS